MKKIKKLITVFLLFICVSISFSQSKKKQIEILTSKLDSINSVLLRSIDDNRELNTTKIALESKISLLKNENVSKDKEIESLKVYNQSLSTELQDSLELLNKFRDTIAKKNSELVDLKNSSITENFISDLSISSFFKIFGFTNSLFEREKSWQEILIENDLHQEYTVSYRTEGTDCPEKYFRSGIKENRSLEIIRYSYDCYLARRVVCFFLWDNELIFVFDSGIEFDEYKARVDGVFEKISSSKKVIYFEEDNNTENEEYLNYQKLLQQLKKDINDGRMTSVAFGGNGTGNANGDGNWENPGSGDGENGPGVKGKIGALGSGDGIPPAVTNPTRDQEGKVVIELTVDKQGNVVDVKVLSNHKETTTTDPVLLNQAKLDGFRYKFKLDNRRADLSKGLRKINYVLR